MDADIIFELQSGNEYDKRCGEIFLTTNGYLLFHCMLCTDKYADYNDYFNHVMEDHFFVTSDNVENLDEFTYESNDYLWDSCSSKAEKEEIKRLGTQDFYQQDDFSSSIVVSVNRKDSDILPNIGPKTVNQILNYKNPINEPNLKSPEHQPDDFMLDEINETESNDTQDEQEEQLKDVKEENRSDFSALPKIRRKSKPSALKPRKYKCTICSLAFKQLQNLRTHLLRHKGEKNFPCVECNKAFFTNQELKFHLRRHYNERPYLCQECGNTFYTGGNLNSHIRKDHKNIRDFQCPECPKSFYQRSMLTEHMSVHRKDHRPFACTVCTSTFPRQKYLRRHMKIHANIRAYVCDLCPQTFNQRAGLTAHKKRRHKSDTETLETCDTNDDIKSDKVFLGSQ